MSVSTLAASLNVDSLRKRVLSWAQRIQHSGLQWKTGVYPAEMATFLGLCEECGVQSLVESGRGPDAYSTHVFGAIAAPMPSVSIDVHELDEYDYAGALRSFSNLRCITGNAFSVMPRAFAGLPGSAGLLLDGPKMQAANRLSAATSLRFPVKVVAHHNCPLTSPWGQEFQHLFPTAFHYEELEMDGVAGWPEFRQWEKDVTGGYEAEDVAHGTIGRSLEQSSLALAVVPEQTQLQSAARALPLFSLTQHPTFLRWSWALRSLFS